MKGLGVHKEMQRLEEALPSPRHTDHPRQTAASPNARFSTYGTWSDPEPSLLSLLCQSPSTSYQNEGPASGTGTMAENCSDTVQQGNKKDTKNM